MRDYTGVPYARVEDPMTRRSLAAIDYFLRDISRGVQRIQQGEVPDGSGAPLGGGGPTTNLADFLFLPGRFGGQTLQMLTGDSAPAFEIQGSPTIAVAQRFIDGTLQQVTSSVCTAGSTTVTHGAVGFASVAVGKLIVSENFPPGTTVVSVGGSGASMVTSAAALQTATITLSFAHITDLAYTPNGGASDFRLLTSSCVQIVGSSTSGGQQSGLRLTAQTAIGSTIRAFIEAGPTNQNLAITGFNGATGSSAHQLFNNSCFSTWTGTALSNNARVGINIDPLDLTTTAPDSLIVQRRASATTTIPTILIQDTVSPGSTESALEVRAFGNSTTIGGTNLGGFRHNGNLMLCTSSGLKGLLSATAVSTTAWTTPIISLIGSADAENYLTMGTRGAWSDNLAAGPSKGLILGDIDTSSRAIFLCSTAFAAFTRFGVASAYSVFWNGGPGTLPAPDAGPTVLRAVNNSAGPIASVVLKAESQRVGQTGDLFQVINTAGTPVFVTAAGKLNALTSYLGTPGTSGGQDTTIALTTSGAGAGGLYFDDNIGFVMQHVTAAGGLTANRTITWPDQSGIVLLLGNKVTLIGSTNSTFDTNTATSGTAFQDTTTTTKKLRFVLSGAVGANSITLTNAAARNYGLGDVGGNIVIAGDQAPAVSAGRLGKVDATGQTAGIGSTNLSSTPPAGVYVVHVVAECTTASGAGAPTLDFNLAWTDTLGATNRNAKENPGETAFPLPLSATGRTSATFVIQVASGNIAYSTTINAAAGTPQYALYVRVVALG